MVKVLIIDDSSFQRRILSGMLTDMGCEVIPADNGMVGIKRAIEDSPDILITDLLMPEYDGYWVLEQIRSQNLPLPVIVITSDIQTTTVERCHRMGAKAFLNKPVKKEDLHAAIRTVLAGGT